MIAPSELHSFETINTGNYERDRAAYQEFLSNIIQGGKRQSPKPSNSPNRRKQSDPMAPSPHRMKSQTMSRVFVIHGHDEAAKLQVKIFLERLGLTPIILQDELANGKAIIDKFQFNAQSACFAIALLTPDDTAWSNSAPNKRRHRARQNVIFELGYFYASLGAAKIAVLIKGDIEIPSDHLGVEWTPLDAKGAWTLRIGKQLRAAGFEVDLNRL